MVNPDEQHDDIGNAIEGTPPPASNTLDLLEKYGVLILPPEIAGNFWPVFLEAVLSHPGPIAMYCAGGGGDAWVIHQMVSMIHQHSKFTGVLLSDAASAHSLAFAACQTRYVAPLGSISVHRCLTFVGGQMNYRAALQAMKRYKKVDTLNAKIMADACSTKYNEAFWLRAFDKASETELTQFDADELIAMGMAKPVSEMSK